LKTLSEGKDTMKILEGLFKWFCESSLDLTMRIIELPYRITYKVLFRNKG